jgi:hypothetical protein
MSLSWTSMPEYSHQTSQKLRTGPKSNMHNYILGSWQALFQRMAARFVGGVTKFSEIIRLGLRLPLVS